MGTKVYEKRTRRFTLHLATCQQCGLTFLEERPEGFDDELYDYYAARLNRSRQELYDPITEARYRDLLARLGRLIPGRRVIDVGCGQGHFVDTALREGWHAEGIDLAEPAIQICERLGVPGRKLDFFDPSLLPDAFDLVTMFELIEHVPDPRAFVRRAAEITRPGGLVYITTPNYMCLDRRVQGLDWSPIHAEHLTYFDPRTLRRLVRDAAPSLEPIFLQTHHLSGETLKRLARRVRPSRAPEKPKAPPKDEALAQARTNDRKLRAQVERSRVLRLAKATANQVLDRTRLGAAMNMLLRKKAAA